MRRYGYDHAQPATAREAIEASHANQHLDRLVRAFAWKKGGTEKPPTRKDEMVAALTRLISSHRLRETIDRLSRMERMATAETAWSDDGVFNKVRFKAKYGKLPVKGGGDKESADGNADDDDSDDEAEAKRDAPPRPMYYSERIRSQPSSLLEVLMPNDVMAKDLQRQLRALLPNPAAAAIDTVEATPDHIDEQGHIWNKATKTYDPIPRRILVEKRAMERAAAEDLIAVLRLVDAGRISITDKNRWPTPASIRAVTDALSGGDFCADPPAAGAQKSAGAKSAKADDDWADNDKPGPIRAFAWPMLLQAGKLAQLSGSKLALTKAGRAALAAPPHETLRDLWGKWVANDLLDEFRRVNVIRGQTGKGSRGMTNPAERRAAIRDALAECPPGQWAALDAFSRYMRAADHPFEVTRDSWSLYITDRQYGSLGQGGDGWEILQFRYLLTVLMEYAATLGLIDVAFVPPSSGAGGFGGLWGTDDLSFLSRYDGLLYMRLNALGAYILGVTETYTPPTPESRKILSLLADLTIAATSPLSAADRMTLDAWAEPAGPETWRLEPRKILTAAAAGHDVAEMAAFLERSTAAPLPDEASDFFDEITRRREALYDQGPARLFTVEDRELAARLANDPAARGPWHLVPPNLVVVPAKADAAFRKALARMGYVLPDRPDAR